MTLACICLYNATRSKNELKTNTPLENSHFLQKRSVFRRKRLPSLINSGGTGANSTMVVWIVEGFLQQSGITCKNYLAHSSSNHFTNCKTQFTFNDLTTAKEALKARDMSKALFTSTQNKSEAESNFNSYKYSYKIWSYFCWLVRGSLFIELGCLRDLGKGWRGDLGTFMISRPI